MVLESRKPIEELYEILESMNLFEVISYSPVPLTQETKFPSAYIVVDGTLNTNNGKMATDGREYNRMIYPTVLLNIDTEGDPLSYLDIYDRVEASILADSELWRVVIDRDVIASKWDSGEQSPKRQGEITLELFYRKTI